MSQSAESGFSFVPYRPRRLDAEHITRAAQVFCESMQRRRSVRMFSREAVPVEAVRLAILAAGTAPSGAHMQPWHFALISDPALKQKIRDAAEAEETLNYTARMSERWKQDLAPLGTDDIKSHITDAPFLIVLFKVTHRIIDGVQVKNYYVNESAGIAAGFLIAALHQAGLAALTHTPTPMRFLSRILNRPEHEVPMLLIPVGYPSEDCMVPDLARKPLAEILTEYA